MWKLQTFAIATLVTLAVSVSVAQASRTIGVYLGVGLGVPVGNLTDDPFKAKSGPRESIGVDVYLHRSLSVGVFFGGDVFGSSGGSLRKEQLGDIYDPNNPDDMTFQLEQVAVAEYGMSIKYFIKTARQLEPYVKMTLGQTWLSIRHKTVGGSSGADSGGKISWGIGGGAMHPLFKKITIAGDLMYRSGKAEMFGGNKSTARLGITVAANLLFCS